MKAKTFFDNEQIEVTLLGEPSSTGLCRVQWGDKKLVRHRNQLTPLDDEAREALKSVYEDPDCDDRILEG